MVSFKNIPWYFVVILLIIGITYLVNSIKSKEGLTFDNLKRIGVSILALLFVLLYLIAIILY